MFNKLNQYIKILVAVLLFTGDIASLWALAPQSPSINFSVSLPEKKAVAISPWHGAKYIFSIFKFFAANESFQQFALPFIEEANEALKGNAIFVVEGEENNLYDFISQGERVSAMPFLKPDDGGESRLPISSLIEVADFMNFTKKMRDEAKRLWNEKGVDGNPELTKTRIREISQAYVGLGSAVLQMTLTYALIKWVKQFHQELGGELDLAFAGPSLGFYTNLAASGRFNLGQILAIITTTHSVILDQIVEDQDPNSEHVYIDRTYRFTAIGKEIFEQLRVDFNEKYPFEDGKDSVLYSFKALGSNSFKVLFMSKKIARDFDGFLQNAISEGIISDYDVEIENQANSTMALHSSASESLAVELAKLRPLLVRFLWSNPLSVGDSMPIVISTFGQGRSIDLNDPEEVLKALSFNHTRPINVPSGEDAIRLLAQDGREVVTMTSEEVLMTTKQRLVDPQSFPDIESNAEKWVDFIEYLFRIRDGLKDSIEKNKIYDLANSAKDWSLSDFENVFNAFSEQFLKAHKNESDDSYQERLRKFIAELHGFFKDQLKEIGVDGRLLKKPMSSWDPLIKEEFLSVVHDMDFWVKETKANYSFWERYISRLEETQVRFSEIVKDSFEIKAGNRVVSFDWAGTKFIPQLNQWLQRGLVPASINGELSVFISPSEPIQLTTEISRKKSLEHLIEAWPIFITSEGTPAFETRSESVTAFNELSSLAEFAFKKLNNYILVTEQLAKFPGNAYEPSLLNDLAKTIEQFLKKPSGDPLSENGGLFDFLSRSSKSQFEKDVASFDKLLLSLSESLGETEAFPSLSRRINSLIAKQSLEDGVDSISGDPTAAAA